MIFCTQKMEKKENVNECKWCLPFEVNFNEANKTVNFVSKQENGEVKYLKINNKKNYNHNNND